MNKPVSKADLAGHTPMADARKASVNDTTRSALVSTMLTPRFYTTDFDEMDKIDVEPVREEWDALIAQMRSDPNKGHFKRNEDWDEIDFAALPDDLREELIDFLVSSLTSEFSGCVLYKEMKRRGKNKEICELFGYMSRDESRHAGFINDALKDFGIGVNMGFLAKAKKYTYFKPKFIYYATYLSEKIGYARYITIFRHLEQHPEHRFHPIFKWFRQWCNDEFSHGEAFSLIIRSDRRLLEGRNKLWIKFFLLAVFTTMYARDHMRPAFHKALGVDIHAYDMRVFKLTSEISRQCFPLVLDLDNPALVDGFRRMERINRKMQAAGAKGGLTGRFGKAWWGCAAGVNFLRMYMIPTKTNALPDTSRLQPVW
ncbi:magnesium-protoporphyrin IX monomethyl ester (oxidative) cyclase [Nitratireductor alexandrii]|uniref:magnesium-protoporphyrin IX monomethyl ester (oxidative) cyclase n=1 Tax=Nitratireductor alexandrii TaxID=2448161 RepID=UPI000FD88C3A